MLVYVLHQNNTPLMPTSPAKARHLLRDGKAVVIQREPFTIQLTVPSAQRVQDVTVGVDLGAKEVGVAAVGDDRVLYQGEVALRTDIHKRMKERAANRHLRRNRLRYRAKRFNNRAASKRKGRLPPAIRSRSDTVIKVVRRIAEVLPVSRVRVEVANFDLQAMKNGSRLQNWQYQRGEQYGFENLKSYIRARDDYTCQYCGKKNPNPLEVEHITPRSRGGKDVPGNLVASCQPCNKKKGNRTAEEYGFPDIQEKTEKRGFEFAAHTMAGKTATLQGLADIAPVEITYGHITKVDREAMGLSKTHYYDAVAIASAGHPVEVLPRYERMKAIARGNYKAYDRNRNHPKDADDKAVAAPKRIRAMSKAERQEYNHLKREARARRKKQGAEGITVTRNLPNGLFGFRSWDKVKLPDGKMGFISSLRRSGSFTIKDLLGNPLATKTYKKLTLISRSGSMPAQWLSVQKEDAA